MTAKSAADLLFEEALQHAIKHGYWHQTPAAKQIADRGLASIDQEESTSTELVEWPHWANWRLVLGEGDECATAVYFTRKPTYAEKKAFCALAGISPEKVEAEERL